MKFKFWLWQFNFRMNRVRDDKKIEFLAKELLKEVEAQGYSLKGTDDVYTLDLRVFTNDNRLFTANIISKWEIACGTYQPRIEVPE